MKLFCDIYLRYLSNQHQRSFQYNINIHMASFSISTQTILCSSHSPPLDINVWLPQRWSINLYKCNDINYFQNNQIHSMGHTIHVLKAIWSMGGKTFLNITLSNFTKLLKVMKWQEHSIYLLWYVTTILQEKEMCNKSPIQLHIHSTNNNKLVDVHLQNSNWVFLHNSLRFFLNKKGRSSQ